MLILWTKLVDSLWSVVYRLAETPSFRCFVLRLSLLLHGGWFLVSWTSHHLRSKLQFGNRSNRSSTRFQGLFLGNYLRAPFCPRLLATLVVSSKNNFQLYFQIFLDDTKLDNISRRIFGFLNSQSSSFGIRISSAIRRRKFISDLLCWSRQFRVWNTSVEKIRIKHVEKYFSYIFVH